MLLCGFLQIGCAKMANRQIVKRNGSIVSFDREKITEGIYRAAASVGGHNRSISESLTDEIFQVIEETFSPNRELRVDEIQEITEKVLIERGHAKTAKAYILYRDYRRREREQRIAGRAKDAPLPWQTMWEALAWNLEHGCESFEKLNQIIRTGRLPWLVRESDKRYNEGILHAADLILSKTGKIKLIIIAGPSSSGKTTTTTKLTQRLHQHGVDAVLLNLDHYFFNLEMHPKDEFGDYDFETPEALDLPLINEHLEKLVNGEPVQMPQYDFKTGKRSTETKTMSVKPNQVILIDTLHGLYEPLTQSISNDRKFKVYIEPISQIKNNHGRFVRWTDIRMLRRMIRDNLYRGYNPEQTIGHWHYVRRSEQKHIIPFLRSADIVLNGALPYEFPYLKKYAFDYFPNTIEQWKNNYKRQDGYKRAVRVFDMLGQIESFEDESIIPDDSLIREFIGGSVYKLH